MEVTEEIVGRGGGLRYCDFGSNRGNSGGTDRASSGLCRGEE